MQSVYNTIVSLENESYLIRKLSWLFFVPLRHRQRTQWICDNMTYYRQPSRIKIGQETGVFGAEDQEPKF